MDARQGADGLAVWGNFGKRHPRIDVEVQQSTVVDVGAFQRGFVGVPALLSDPSGLCELGRGHAFGPN